MYASGLEERVGGIIRFYMTWAGQLVMILALGIPVFLWASRGWERILLAVALLLQIGCLAFTFTRGAYVGLFVALLFIALMRSWKWILLPAGGIILSFLLLPHSVVDRALSSFDFQDWTVAHRFAMLRVGWQMFRDHPIFGVGLINLQPIYRTYMLPTDEHIPLHLHNDFLQTLATMGICGLLAFAFFLWRIVAGEVRAHRNQSAEERLGKALGLGCLAATVGFLVNGLFEYNFGDSEVLMLFYFTVGLSIALGRMAGEPAPP